MSKQSTIKKTVITALKGEYGFGPRPGDITIKSATDDRTAIDFRVGYSGHTYQFRSYINIPPASVWCGPGTITKVS